MIATFKETARSVRDTKYGSVIVKRTVGESIWYWTKYLIAMVVIGVCMGIAALTYYVPQLPKVAMENLPDIQVAVKDGKFSTNAVEPFVRGDENFSLILNSKGDVTDLDNFKTGMLVLSDRVVVKSENETRIMDLKEVQNFSADRNGIVSWLKSHQSNLMGIGVVSVIVIAIFLGGFFWIWQMVWFVIWAAIMMLASKLMKKPVEFANALKIVAYASVISLILRVLFSAVNVPSLPILAFVAFLFYAFSWVNNLNSK